MNAYDYPYRIQFKQPSDDQDELGQPLEVWTTVASSWANIKNLNGFETIKSGAQTSITTVSIRVPKYRTDINTGMRIYHGATIYNIKAVLPDMAMKEHTDFVCEVVL